jgi:hypothetical protein
MANENFLQGLSPQEILFYARQPGTIGDNTLQQALALVEELFPTKGVLGLTYEYWIGQNTRPVMATITPYDVEAPLASRIPIEPPKRGSMPKIQRKIRLGEEEKLMLIKVLQNKALEAEVKQYISDRYNDVDAMVSAVQARKAYLALQALFTMGAITFAEDGVILTVDFGVPAGQREVLSTPWSDPAANPYEDFRRFKAAVEDAQGISPTRALTSRAVVNYLLGNDKMRELVIGRNFTAQAIRAVPSLQVLNEYLAANELPEIATFDGKVLVEDAAGARALTRLTPQDKFIMLPDGPLGHMLEGTTAEALGMVENGTLDVSDAPGIWAGVTKESDPPVQYTKAAMVAFPTFPTADRVFQAEVI